MTNAALKQNSRQERKARTRQGLIRTATQLFARRGIANTATADIAQSLKVSHGTVFIHFPTREEFILAVIDDFGARLSQAFQSKMSGGLTLKELLTAHLDTLAEFEEFYFRLVSELNTLPSAVRSTVFMLNANVSWRMWEIAKDDIKAGRMRNLERAELFNTWMALVHYYLLNRELFAKTKHILSEKRDELIRHFLCLLKN